MLWIGPNKNIYTVWEPRVLLGLRHKWYYIFAFQPNKFLINICFLLLVNFVVACKEGGWIRRHSSRDIHWNPHKSERKRSGSRYPKCCCKYKSKIYWFKFQFQFFFCFSVSVLSSFRFFCYAVVLFSFNVSMLSCLFLLLIGINTLHLVCSWFSLSSVLV
jgi:hypothetical protein